jgi:Flp pilus assembly protein TadG
MRKRLSSALQKAAALARAIPPSATLRRFLSDGRANVAVSAALAAPVLIGVMGLASEAAYWRLHQRAMQNAADSAAMAAAMNGASNYDAEGKAVASQYGFTDGAGSVTVTITNPSSATGCTSDCYVATVTDAVPVMLAAVVGYTGSTVINGRNATALSASAVAQRAPTRKYCVLALAGSGAQGITSNGAPFANLNGCNMMSDTTATCNGHNVNATYGDAVSRSNGCGITPESNMPYVADPYSGLAANIPANTCSSYAQEPAKKKDPPLPSSNQLSGSYGGSGQTVTVCGDAQLTGNVTMNNAVLVVENGQLDLNGYTLSGSGLTIIFSGTNSSSYQHILTGSGTLDITSPSSGVWKEVAIYQDPALTTNVNFTYAGNSPTWNISGLGYFPHSSVTFSGAVNKSSVGNKCFTMVVDNITINGTGSIFEHDTECVTQPSSGFRATLVN